MLNEETKEILDEHFIEALSKTKNKEGTKLLLLIRDDFYKRLSEKSNDG